MMQCVVFHVVVFKFGAQEVLCHINDVVPTCCVSASNVASHEAIRLRSLPAARQRHAGELDEREEQLDDEKDYVAKTGM